MIHKVKTHPLVKSAHKFLSKITLPGFEGLSIVYVVKFFLFRANEVSVNLRASALAFRFFLAIFPSLIFLFTLIPYIPVENFQEELMMMMEKVMPKGVYGSIRETLNDLVTTKQSGLLSFGFLFTLYLTTNGIRAMIESFNDTSHTPEKRSPLKIWGVSLLMVFLLTLLLSLGIGLIVFGEIVIAYLVDHRILTDQLSVWALIFAKWLLMLSIFFFSIALLYYAGPAKPTHFRVFSAGATLATIFIIAASLGFGYYVNHFANYNKLYGSLGTVIVIMLWIYFNALGILLGYELNNTIAKGSIARLNQSA